MAASVMPPPTWVRLLLLVAYAAAAPSSGVRSTGLNKITRHPLSIHQQLHHFRGGAISDGEYDDEYDSDEYDDEPIVTNTKKLASSTKSAIQKKKAAAIKAKVKVAMTSSNTAKAAVAKKSGGANLYKRYVPYIVRACLNPFTLISMTKAYFVSLVDVNYLKEEQSQGLRSALEDKARKQQPSSGSTKPKRKMRPGQSKTLSDLPQLSA